MNGKVSMDDTPSLLADHNNFVLSAYFVAMRIEISIQNCGGMAC